MKKQNDDIGFLPPIREFSDRGAKWLLKFGEAATAESISEIKIN